METPYLPQTIFGKDFEHVYEPAEDTFLLLDALERDIESIKSNTRICLECGSGSGTVITALSKLLNGESNQVPQSMMLATDINPFACKTTKKCAVHHEQRHIQIIRTDIAAALVDRLQQSVDLLVFNPPYVPSDNKETVANSPNPINLSWAGGPDGRRVIDIFLGTYVPKLLSKPDGVAYLVALDSNSIEELLHYFDETLHRIEGTIVVERRAGMEHLFVLKYRWIIK